MIGRGDWRRSSDGNYKLRRRSSVEKIFGRLLRGRKIPVLNLGYEKIRRPPEDRPPRRGLRNVSDCGLRAKKVVLLLGAVRSPHHQTQRTMLYVEFDGENAQSVRGTSSRAPPSGACAPFKKSNFLRVPSKNRSRSETSQKKNTDSFTFCHFNQSQLFEQFV